MKPETHQYLVDVQFISGIKKAIEDGADFKENEYALFKFAVLNNNTMVVDFFLENYDIDLKYDDVKFYVTNNKKLDELLKSKLK